MIFWTAVHIASAALATWIVSYMLVRHRGALTLPERMSMATIAGCMVLRIAPVLGKAMEIVTPFDDWASSLMNAALAVLLLCWAARLEKVAGRINLR